MPRPLLALTKQYGCDDSYYFHFQGHYRDLGTHGKAQLYIRQLGQAPLGKTSSVLGFLITLIVST